MGTLINTKKGLPSELADGGAPQYLIAAIELSAGPDNWWVCSVCSGGRTKITRWELKKFP